MASEEQYVDLQLKDYLKRPGMSSSVYSGTAASASASAFPSDCFMIYTDGACSKNGFEGASAGIGVYFGRDDPRNVSKPVPADYPQTNQTAELLALEIAVEAARDEILAGKYRRAMIMTDSAYSINCVTNWYKSWQRNGWVTANRTPVKYRKEIRNVSSILESLPSIELIKVKGHSGVEGNEEADRLAREGVIHRPLVPQSEQPPSPPPPPPPSTQQEYARPRIERIYVKGKVFEVVDRIYVDPEDYDL